ncbi:MAG TPA: NAD-dependent epimerase/dehydratase family protein, partial [Steroidobacteraceae bacterium]|nr:NAD-dependent epimerase/dehydratase family protein [Steroidobacteraceae bacterium]
MRRVLVTGATGFVGQVLCAELAKAGYTVRAALRTERSLPAGMHEKSVVGEIDGKTRWEAALEGVDSIIHAAARTHVLRKSSNDAELYARTNVLGTERLATAAVSAGVRRFIYVSTIKVNGEESAGPPYRPDDEPRPTDPYGRSKLQAERVLARVGAAGRMSCAIVRPPLVYGPGVRANFLRLMRWIDRERPLPFGAVHNRRSLVSVWNLSDLLVRLLAPAADSGKIWLVSDGEDLSTPELIHRLAGALHRRARLVPVPPAVLRLCGLLTGTSDQVARLCGSLVLDGSETR